MAARGTDLVVGATTEGLPIAPTMGPALAATGVSRHVALVDARVAFIGALAVLIAFAASGIARALTMLIAVITNLTFFGRFSTAMVSPADNALGWWVVAVPVVGGIIVGLMARYGSEGIRGHGIPEAMEQVLRNESRIAPRLTFLKPISAAIAIGTGGPFGAEGPIIATGGALGSLVGQVLATTPAERKTLLAAGAAAGMAATFGTPVAAVLLAVELLLFELRPRSIIPVALASATATGMRIAMLGAAPVFPMSDLAAPGGTALTAYIALGAVMGAIAVVVTRSVYAIEDAFDHLPIHWMWWPAIGGVVVGIVGIIAPRTLGVGYDNITAVLSGNLAMGAVLVLSLMKFVSWSVALGSGTSGGTLAPLFTMGGGVGAVLGTVVAALLPNAGIDVRIAALVGMAAMFAGASRALMTSVVFAFETTLQPIGLLPLLGGCSTAFFVSCLLMRNSIMTEKIARRGVRVPSEYVPDFFEQVLVRECSVCPAVTLQGDDTVEQTRAWIAAGSHGSDHQGFPVLDGRGDLIGVLTRRDLLQPSRRGSERLAELITRPSVVVYDTDTLRQAADLMAQADVGRLPVVSVAAPRRVSGMLTRRDLLAGHRRRLQELRNAGRLIRFRPARWRAAGTVASTTGEITDAGAQLR